MTSTSTSSESESPTLDISTLDNAEIVEITTIISRKLFERRSGVPMTTNRLAMKLLELTANRLDEGGDRDIVVVTSSDPIKTVSDERIHENDKKGKTSDRLASARQILATIEQ